jgi:nitrogen fixation protein FixH
MSTTLHDPRRGRWIPWAFVGGMGLVVAVNAVLITAAVSTFTGVTEGRTYDRGRAYNHVLEEAARQDALGWRAEVAAAEGQLRVLVRDREARPVAGRLEGVLRRPLDGRETAIVLEAAGPGLWTAALSALPPGQWEARLSLTDAEAHRLDIRQRVFLR